MYFRDRDYARRALACQVEESIDNANRDCTCIRFLKNAGIGHGQLLAARFLLSMRKFEIVREMAQTRLIPKAIPSTGNNVRAA